MSQASQAFSVATEADTGEGSAPAPHSRSWRWREFDGLMAWLASCYRKPLGWRIGFGIAAALSGMLLRMLLLTMLGENFGYPFLTLFPAVWVAALLGGFVSGGTTSVLCAIQAYLWSRQLASPSAVGVQEALASVIFLAMTSLVLIISELMHRNWIRLGAAEARAGRESELRKENESRAAERMMIMEDERQRISRELHDSLGQYLAAINMNMKVMAAEASGEGNFRHRLSEVEDMTSAVAREVSRLAWELRPLALDDLGLQAAIEGLTHDWGQRSKLRFDLMLTLGDRRLPPAVETTLYRVVQEAVTNVVKHANATTVGVILRADCDEVTLIFEDDGQGFRSADPDGGAESSSGLGLLGMRERLSTVGGRLEIESAPGRGATLIIRAPLKKQPGPTR